MAKKVFTDESLATFVDEVKSYTDSAVSGKANSSHNHNASNINAGTLSSDRLPTVPIAKGGTGATTAAAALTNLGITATAAELNKLDGVTATAAEINYVDGVTSNIQTQLDTLTSNKVSKTGDTMTGDLTIEANFGSVRFNDADGNKMSVLQANNDSHTTSIYAYPTDKSTYYEKYDFPTPDTGRTSNKSYRILTTKDVTATVAELNYVDGVTSNIQTQLNGKASSDHTHSAYVNQNAFSNIAVSGQTTVAADTATDTVTFAGSNMSITTNATTDTVTFSVANASTSAKGVVQLVDSATNTATDKAATANAVNTAYTLASKANTTANSAKTTAESKSTVEASSTNGKIKINGTDTTVYTHPTTAGNKHIPSGGSSGQVLKYSASGTATWGTDKDTTYSLSSGDNNGTIKITPSSGSAYNVAVKGLGSVAYTNTVPIAQGGTGATTVEAARENLSVYSKEDIDSMEFITIADIDDICNPTYASKLYKYYGVDKNEYPYLTMRVNLAGGLKIYFSSTMKIDGVNELTISSYMHGTGVTVNASNHSDIDEYVTTTMNNLSPSSLSLLEQTNMLNLVNEYVYTNYDASALTNVAGLYRLDE